MKQKAIRISIEIEGKRKQATKAYLGEIDHILRRMPKVLKRLGLPKDTKLNFEIGVFDPEMVGRLRDMQDGFELED